MVAAWCVWTGRADQVWLLPAYQHAFEKQLAPWPARLRMTEALAQALGPWARVEPIEGSLPVPSYTVHTLDALAQRHPEHRFHLVIGADVLAQLPLWRESARLQAEYPLIVVGREGHPDVDGAPSFPDVSSTDIRRRLRERAPVDGLLPVGVREIAESLGLYAA
jgi:nicotinate-nucleotide adenylyltransferase